MKWTGLTCALTWLVFATFVTLIPGCGSRETTEIDTVATPVASVVNNINIADDYFNRKVRLKTRVYYRANDYHRCWLGKRRPEKLLDAFVKEVNASSEYGLNPHDYQLERILQQVDSLYNDRDKTNARLAELDIEITARFFLFTTHLIDGRIRYPGAREFLWKRGMPLDNDIAMLLQTSSGAELRKLIEDLQPTDPQYKRLKAVLKQYRKNIVADTLPDSIRHKVDLIILNLERLRWDPHLQGRGDEIVINVPEYTMRVYRDGKERMKMRVVLGSEYTPTPVFHDTLQYIVFNPTWAVPRSIFAKEFLPRLIEDPAHYDPDRFIFYKNGERIDPRDEKWSSNKLDTSAFRAVENPGENNALGKVKFMMPNDHAIYLHDTPASSLFSRKERALSHGCIRLEHPEEFARYLLADRKDWDDDRIREAMSGKTPSQVELDRPFPVYIIYRTVWVDDDNVAHFRDDIYGHDKRQFARLIQNGG